MAQSTGLSKKHSPLQKTHYQAYRLVNRAEHNLIKRLRVRVKRADVRMIRCIKRNLKIDRLLKKGVTIRPTKSYQKRDTGAIKALNKLRVNVA